jgi:hypothetical protein
VSIPKRLHIVIYSNREVHQIDGSSELTIALCYLTCCQYNEQNLAPNEGTPDTAHRPLSMPFYPQRQSTLQPNRKRIVIGTVAGLLLVVFIASEWMYTRSVYAGMQPTPVLRGGALSNEIAHQPPIDLHPVQPTDTIPRDSPASMTAGARRKTCPFKPPSSGGGAIQTSGGWLYDESVIATHHVAFDDGFGTALASFLGTSSVYDIGAGVGQLQRLLKKKESPVDYAGFDGGDNIESMWGKTTPVRGDPYHVVPEICWINAAAPVSLPKRDWVISIEVGEHIPQEYEAQFIDNLVGLCTDGVIVSWAVPGQGGRGHINEISNDYLVAEMRNRGFKYDIAQTTVFRESVSGGDWWLKGSLMVYRRSAYVTS